MARTSAVWGIDIGQCASRRCAAGGHDDPDKIAVEAFDYIEYPKILTQPDANPAELIADALKQFLSRNQVHNDRVAVSVSGQSGLARFIKLPPVEAKKIPDIVRYEARQQIPFDLNDVIWDYQRMGGGSGRIGLRAGNGNRTVRHEARRRVPGVGAVRQGGHRGRHRAACPAGPV